MSLGTVAGTHRNARNASVQRPGSFAIDWRAVRRAERACCCPGRPVVITIMPPAAARPHPTDLLLCGHHHRMSREVLAAAGAIVMDLNRKPVRDGARLAQAGV